MIYPESEAGDALGKSTITQLPESLVLGIAAEEMPKLHPRYS